MNKKEKESREKKKGLSGKAVAGIAAGLALTFVIISLAYIYHEEFKKTVISQTQQQLLMLAKTTASRLEEYIVEHSDALKTLSKNPVVQEEIHNRIPHGVSDTGYCPVKTLYEIHEDDMSALTTLDSNGIMLHRHPFMDNRPGMSHTDKPGVAYVVREHKPYVSEAFYNNLGNLAMSISEPVFYRGEFAGIVRWMIQLDKIAERFIRPIRLEATRAQVVDENGMILCHHDKERTGKHIIAHKKEKYPYHDGSAFESVVRKMTKGQKGTAAFYCPIHGNVLISYAPVHIGDQSWSVTIIMDYSQIAGPINRHERNTFGLAGFAMLLFGSGGGVLFRTQKRKAELKAKARHLRQIAESAEALRLSEEKLSGIVASVTDHMSMIDEEHNIVWVNDIAKELFGPDLVGRKCYSIYHARDNVCESCIAKKCFEDGKVHEHETEVAGADGNKMILWCTASVAERHSDGRPKMVIEIARNITARKRAEKEQLQREKLEGVIEMAGAVCHELNQPMQAVLGRSQLLMLGVAERNPLNGDIKKIIQQIGRMGEITNKLMRITKYESRDYIGGKKIIDIDKASGPVK